MKRVGPEQEDADDARKQGIVRAMVELDLSFTLSQIPEFVLAFRYHPQRLIRLMNTSKKLFVAVESLARQFPSLWYELCLYAFPDIAIMLTVCASHFPFSKAYEKVSKIVGYWTIDGAFLTYIPPYSVNPTAWDLVTLTDRATEVEKFNLHRASQARSFAHGKVSSSFTSQALLDQCTVDESRARRVAHCFKMLFPFGVPPSPYCFASQIVLQKLALECILSLKEGWVVPFLEEIYGKYTPIHRQWLNTRLTDNLKRATLEEMEIYLDGPVESRTFAGLIIEDNKPDWAGDAVDLPELAGAFLTLVRAGKVKDKERAPLLYDRIIKNALIYDRTGELSVSAFPSIETDKKPWELLSLVEGEETPEILQLKNVEIYGAVDPLYWKVLLQRGTPEVGGLDWRDIIKVQIMIVKGTFPLDSEERMRIETVSPLSTLSCMVCGNQRRDTLCFEESRPFGVYCDEECRKK